MAKYTTLPVEEGEPVVLTNEGFALTEAINNLTKSIDALRSSLK